jgi:Fe2+ or Zn2+ uptake regulation protein
MRFIQLLTHPQEFSMVTVSIPEILAQLKKLPPEKLSVVYDFVSYLSERETVQSLEVDSSEAFKTMLANQTVLKVDWDRPEEDQAWASL